jgi:hypothetical protein
MTNARIERVPADPVEATVFLAQARRLARDGTEETLSDTGRHLLIYQAGVSTMDAVLMAAGQRVTAGDNAHRLRLEAAERLLGGGNEDLFDRLDGGRRMRHEVSYAASVVSDAQLESIEGAVEELIAAADEFISSR